ncbi:exodeoxyribonuclease VII large subunit [bacterium]|nr:exodeoxyribonuclease VII large subunit [Candidatus Elulimicrobium humile]
MFICYNKYINSIIIKFVTGKQLDTYFQDIIRERGERALYSIQVFLAHTKPSYRQASLRALISFEWERVSDLIIPLLQDSSILVKKEAIRTLAHFAEGKQYLESNQQYIPDALAQYAYIKTKTPAISSGILSVSAFIQQINLIIGEQVVQIEGEVSAFQMSSFANNQWVFFDLKDEQKEAKIRCFTTIVNLRKSRISPVDGMRIIITGKPRLSPKSGIFSVMVETLAVSGEGELAKAFELLRQKLESEGLFSEDRKRAIPEMPKSIGIITSQDAAAYKDFIKVLGARMGDLNLYFHHAQVQGERAVDSIIEAIENLNTYPEVEVIVLTRGGGAMDDLHAFNDESVARAIYTSVKPIISAIGHERDITIADFVADMRASTPSNAAELLTPHRDELRANVEQKERILQASIQCQMQIIESRINQNLHILERYTRYIADTVRNIIQKLENLIFQKLNKIQQYQHKVHNNVHSLNFIMSNNLVQSQNKLALLQSKLSAFDPQTILQKGYSITKIYDKIIIDSSGLKEGDILTTQFYNGRINSKVIKK